MASEIIVQSEQPTLMAVIDRILTNNPNANLDTVQQMLALQERWESKQAEKAFNVAFADFKSEAVSIVKNVTVKDGPLKDKKYADLFGVVSIITPAMSKHGLSHSWKLTKDEPTWMEVTCVIRHVLGHRVSVSMGAAPDTGPGRNAIQARGSAKSYLERYTLLAAIGMAATDEDNDGSDVLSPAVQALLDDISKAGDMQDLQNLFTAAYKTGQKAKDRRAMAAYIEAKDKRKAELTPKDGE